MTMSSVTLPRSREERLIVDGRLYRLFIAWPAGDPPERGWPVIYTLDANAAFATVVEAIRMRSHRPDATGVRPAVVVGVGYPGDGPYERVRRTFDYSRPDASRADGADRDAAVQVGGAERFRLMLARDIPDLVMQMLPIDRAHATIIGHSLAAYFVLETLAAAPQSFETYVAISPSVWWDERGLTDRLRGLAAQPSPAGRRLKVLITAGEYEQKLAPWQQGQPPVLSVAERRQDRRMVDLAQSMAAIIESIPGIDVQFQELPGQDHASVVPITISEAVRLAFR